MNKCLVVFLFVSITIFFIGCSKEDAGESAKAILVDSEPSVPEIKSVSTEIIYDYTYPFSEGLACVRRDGKYGFIDMLGNTIIPFIYDNATPFMEDLAYFANGDSYGFIDKGGDIAFLLECDSISSFQEGLAFFFRDGKYGFIDTSGSIAIDPIFDDAGFFKDGLAKVRIGYKYGFIDKSGEFIVPAIYDDITVSGDYFLVKSTEKYGVLDLNGKQIIAPEQEVISDEYATHAAPGDNAPSNLLLRNEVTPRIKTFSDFIKNGIIDVNFNEYQQAKISSLNNLIHYYKLYSFNSGAPIMYYYAQPFETTPFAESHSGFFSVKDGEINSLLTGYQSGGSMGGDAICFYQDNRTREIFIGTFSHIGGFGGYMSGGNIYNINDNDVNEISSYYFLYDSARNHEDDVLLENAHLYYNDNHEPYNKETILQAKEDGLNIYEFSVNGQYTSLEKYEEVVNKYPMLVLWDWEGY